MFPERRHHLHLLLALLLAILPWHAGAAQQSLLGDLKAQRQLPIELEANASEFDRAANRMVFHGMHVTQGSLSVRADRAETAQLDFDNTRWLFSGNVRIINQDTRIWCSSAELLFVDHQLKSVLIQGSPAHFEQQRPEDEMTEGRAQTMDYTVDNGQILFLGDAWVSDGSNEIAGDRISYDLARQHVIAEAGTGGRVRMKINPAQRDQNDDETP